ncbi:hypothetical protein BC835DRAFT_1270792 [Cytidiella melzeri]|nr:hypothetical protein BC835DRAFT_1270792 [Cytidiella melzeri]
MVYIPPELSDYIIDFLHDNRAALKACSLTARSWYPAARYHLYWRVSLPHFKSFRTYCSLLDICPTLGSFTRNVKLSNTFPLTTSRKGQLDVPRQDMEQLWEFMLPKLTATECLELSFLAFQPVLANHLARNLTTVTDISLQYCSFDSFSSFAAVICSFPCLQSCVLRGISWHNAITPAAPTHSGTKSMRPRLASLSLGRDVPLEDLLPWLLEGDACRDLIHFSGSCSSEHDALLLGEVLKSASATLKEVELDWYSASYHDVQLPFDFTIGSCLSLESLSLRCPIALHSTVPWVTSLLNQVNPAQLKTIYFEIRLLGSLEEGLDWASLDSRLLREDFAQLAAVDIKILVWHTATAMSDGVEQAVHRLLPLLDSKGVLRTHCH